MKITQTSIVKHKNIIKKWKSGEFNPIEDYKFKILLDDNHIIEAGVFSMKTKRGIEHHACVSTQAGCKYGCKMCSSGKNGFSRNLSAQEILDEIKLLEKKVGVPMLDEILFMGIGEPLDNYDNFVSALKQLPSYGGRLSFATVCLPKKLIELSRENLPKLKMVWISLHASSDKKRSIIMPVNKIFNIKTILNAAKKFALSTKIDVWINYLLFQDFNDSDKDAELLVKLMKNSESYFKIQISAPNNNIPNHKAADGSQLILFESKLKKLGLKNDIFCFEAAGKDVHAGCGEFVYLVK